MGVLAGSAAAGVIDLRGTRDNPVRIATEVPHGPLPQCKRARLHKAAGPVMYPRPAFPGRGGVATGLQGDAE